VGEGGTCGYPRRRKGHDVEGGEVRAQKRVLLKLLGPREELDELRRAVDERLELARLLAVHHRHEPGAPAALSAGEIVLCLAL